VGIWVCFYLSWPLSVTSLRALGHSSGNGFIRTLPSTIALHDKRVSRNEKHSSLECSKLPPFLQSPTKCCEAANIERVSCLSCVANSFPCNVESLWHCCVENKPTDRFPRMVIESQSSTTVLKSFSEPTTKSTNPLSSPPRPASLSPSRLRQSRLDPSPLPQPQTATRRTCSAHSAAYPS
jgi:hypothetical protein